MGVKLFCFHVIMLIILNCSKHCFKNSIYFKIVKLNKFEVKKWLKTLMEKQYQSKKLNSFTLFLTLIFYILQGKF
jgi:hypothetical protein